MRLLHIRIFAHSYEYYYLSAMHQLLLLYQHTIS